MVLREAKAFDTVTIPILLNKLEALKIRGIQHKLLQDYKQLRVTIDKITNDELPIVRSVRQGSIMIRSYFLSILSNYALFPTLMVRSIMLRG